MHKKILPLLITTLLPTASFAGKNNIDYLNFASQRDFENFANDLTGALAYKTLRPTEPFGIAGFDVGLTGSLSSFKHKQMGSVSSNGGGTMETYTLSATKGLPLDIDIGLDYTFVPNSNITTWSGNLSWSLTEGGTATPAVGFTGSYTQTNGISAINYSSYGLDVGISKGFLNFTPYASAGLVSSTIQAKETNVGLAGQLKDASSLLTKLAIGININLLFMDVLIAAEQIGEVPTYSLKAGYRF